VIVAIPTKQVTTSKSITPGKPKNEYKRAPPIGPIRTEMASALSNKAETLVTSCFLQHHLRKHSKLSNVQFQKFQKLKQMVLKVAKSKYR
jgi:hypothetical protein